MHTENREAVSIDRIYLHTNEGPQGFNSAFNLKGYLDRIDAGYHVVVDEADTVRCADDNQVVWAEGGDNMHSLSICMIGYSGSTDWTSQYSQAMIERAAQQVAAWCRAYNIPAVRVAQGPPGGAPTQRGIAEHADDHAPQSEGHTDPGTRFPIAAFIARVQAILAPPGPATVAKIVAWLNDMKVPVSRGDRGPKVASLNDWLIVNGANPAVRGDAFGVATANAVSFLKSAWHLPDHRGSIAGYEFATALVAHAVK